MLNFLTTTDKAEFEIVLSNGKMARFQTALEMSEYYDRNKTINLIRHNKKKKRAKVDVANKPIKYSNLDEINIKRQTLENNTSHDEPVVAKRIKSKYKTLVRKKPGNEQLIKSLNI